MKKGKRMLDKISDAASAEALVLPGRTVLEVYADRRVLIEVHGGILEYDANRILVRVSFGTICVCGACLKVAQMSMHQLVISGKIHSIYLNRGESM